MGLPPINLYYVMNYIQSSGTQYIDTGIKPSDYLNTLRIEADMSYVSVPTGSSTQSYLFGTGYYNSNANNRRNILAGYRGATSTTLFSYLNGGQLSGAVSFAGATLDTNRHKFVIDQPNGVYGFDDNTQSFTGTMSSNVTANLLIFAARSTGSNTNVAYYSSARLYSFVIFDGDTVLREFIPCKRRSDNAYGLWDGVNGVFYTNSGTGSFTGGFEVKALASPSNAGTVTGTGVYTEGSTVNLTAVPYGNYRFTGWSDGDTNPTRTVTVTQPISYVANFEKIKTEIGEEFRLMGKKRAVSGSGYVPLDQPPTLFTNVYSADINEDLLQKATSTIVCEDATGFEEGDLVMLRDGKDHIIYNGFVESVEGNTITASQKQSFFNFELYAMADTSTDKSNHPNYTAMKMLYRYLWDIKWGASSTLEDSGQLYVDPSDGVVTAINNGINIERIDPASMSKYPYRTENEVVNGEELMYDAYSQFEIIPYLWINEMGHTTPTDWSCFYLFLVESMENGTDKIPPYRTLSMSDNVEFLTDIQVTTTLEDANVLIIYNSAGTTYRGGYYVLTDGTYQPYSYYVVSNRYLPPRRKYVNSDEALTEIRDKELALIQHNHKITFTFDLDNNFYDFGDFGLGQNIDLYVKDRLYHSVLTGWSYHIEQGKMLKFINMTCGKVRTNLTSKLNLGKAGKKR